MKILYKVYFREKIQLSKKICNKLKIKKGDELEEFLYKDLIILKKPIKETEIDFLELHGLDLFLRYKDLITNGMKRGFKIKNIPHKVVNKLCGIE
ncbi:hypothetical protein CMI37_32535 [Candidatus Pacearchaeota archaeon]|nr:hypothetical protein [Candidatus Pacearchaeota archaeon]|tara:strand:- start:25654 stop:25938 length:285 start_codon:yes stop_codon:yes gene_type:complete